MMSTINDVSRLAGVSKATVSRVLSGSRGVKEASRQAVLQAAEALNYRPNMIAQSLLSQSTGCIGVIGARFPLNINRPDVVLVDCLDSEGDNSIQFDHAFAAETACHYLISQGRRQIALIHPQSSGFADQVLLGYKHALEKNFLPFNRNLVFLDNTSPSVAVQELVNNATTLNFNALLVSDEQQAQRVVPQLQAFNRAVPQNVMVFSLAGSLQLPGIPTIPAIEYSMDAMASRIVNWLTEKTDNPGGSPLRGDLIIPKH